MCWFDRHAPLRDDAKWDGKYYVSPCKFCKKPIVRRERGIWTLVRRELS